MEQTLHAKTQRVNTAIQSLHAYIQSLWIFKQMFQWLHPLYYVFHLIFAFVTGTEYLTRKAKQELELSKSRLKHNDIYRDRLLELEIEHFVDIGDALGMTSIQRHHFFLQFLKLDWTRRSAITIKDLFLFCGLRRSRFADVMFPIPVRKESFRQLKDRFEISPFLCLLFSFCSMPPSQLLMLTVDKADTDEVVANIIAQDIDYLQRQQIAEATMVTNRELGHALRLQLQITRLIMLAIGTLNENEKKLRDCLQTLYGDVNEDSNLTQVQDIHDICDFIRLYPVLIYPIFWIQRTLRRRILGHKFWYSMVEHRKHFETLIPNKIFFTPQDILSCASLLSLNNNEKVLPDLQSKKRQKVLPSSWLLYKKKVYSPTCNKVLKAEIHELIDSTEASHGKEQLVSHKVDSIDSGILNQKFDVAIAIEAHHNEDEAWRVSADNLMAVIHIKQLQLEKITLPAGATFASECQRVANALAEKTISIDELQAVRKSVIKRYGYQFCDFIFRFGHHNETITKKSTEKMRSKKTKMPQVPVISTNQWEKIYDPGDKCHFYYNVHTGESVWEVPPNAVVFTRDVKSKYTKRKKQK
ncbi:hypothetical protein THRCLA_03770 [Thraustotheca clavata]|uniref:WW domain-containing protein n=1 Tax=Thraustotheca clavata TaxID=74557 RepID=A0A1W0A0Y2_9STRA|nr:hypothetical protein THRCLA_03770 [Thraustotheca clavata]